MEKEEDNTKRQNKYENGIKNTRFIVEREYKGKDRFEELYKGIVNSVVSEYLCKT